MGRFWQLTPLGKQSGGKLQALVLVPTSAAVLIEGSPMKRLIAVLAFLGLMFLGLSQAQAESKYVPTQKTLTDAVGRAILLSDIQKAEIEAVVRNNPKAEKFICTGIRLVGTSDRMNLVVRKRAKEACDYAKKLNPELSTWYQSKTTNAASYNGRVLLVLKTPAN
jgi:hypothetical protein